MYNIKIDISDLKEIVSKLNLAIEKTKINPKAGWIELEMISEDALSLSVANYDYYINAKIKTECPGFDKNNRFHVTISADTFIPLVSKLDSDYVYVTEGFNAVIFTTDTNEYTFPTIKELGRVKSVDKISYSPVNDQVMHLTGEELASIAESNSRGLIDTLVSREIQQFIYVDLRGAITFTENVYINDFVSDNSAIDLTAAPYVKFLLNCTQAKLFKIFESFNTVALNVELFSDDRSKKIKLTASDSRFDIEMVLVVQCDDLTQTFPELKLRALADSVRDVHAVISKKDLDKALSRLMVFDKKWDITVLDYSKLVFDEDKVKLVSIKNKNYETILYINSSNTIKHESIIRFADLVAQLKAIKSKDIDISYGDSAIVINSGNLKQLIPEIKSTRV